MTALESALESHDFKNLWEVVYSYCKRPQTFWYGLFEGGCMRHLDFVMQEHRFRVSHHKSLAESAPCDQQTLTVIPRSCSAFCPIHEHDPWHFSLSIGRQGPEIRAMLSYLLSTSFLPSRPTSRRLRLCDPLLQVVRSFTFRRTFRRTST